MPEYKSDCKDIALFTNQEFRFKTIYVKQKWVFICKDQLSEVSGEQFLDEWFMRGATNYRDIHFRTIDSDNESIQALQGQGNQRNTKGTLIRIDDQKRVSMNEKLKNPVKDYGRAALEKTLAKRRANEEKEKEIREKAERAKKKATEAVLARCRQIIKNTAK